MRSVFVLLAISTGLLAQTVNPGGGGGGSATPAGGLGAVQIAGSGVLAGNNADLFAQLTAIVPAAPVVTCNGGAVTWSYVVTAVNAVGESLGSTAGTSTTGVDTLNGTDKCLVQTDATGMPAGVTFNLYITAAGSGGSTGQIVTGITPGALYTDTSGNANGPPVPLQDTSQGLFVDGFLNVTGAFAVHGTGNYATTNNGDTLLQFLYEVNCGDFPDCFDGLEAFIAADGASGAAASAMDLHMLFSPGAESDGTLGNIAGISLEAGAGDDVVPATTSGQIVGGTFSATNFGQGLAAYSMIGVDVNAAVLFNGGSAGEMDLFRAETPMYGNVVTSSVPVAVGLDIEDITATGDPNFGSSSLYAILVKGTTAVSDFQGVIQNDSIAPGSGTYFVCVGTDGKLFSSATACAI